MQLAECFVYPTELIKAPDKAPVQLRVVDDAYDYDPDDSFVAASGDSESQATTDASSGAETSADMSTDDAQSDAMFSSSDDTPGSEFDR